MHTFDTLNTITGQPDRFNRGRREMAATGTLEALTPAIDTRRIYTPHEAGYWAAQRHGFDTIRRLDRALEERDSWAGRYSGRFDHELEEWVVDDDCSDEFDEAHQRAVQIAADAAQGNARGIIVAQGRDDEAALLILAARPSPG